MELAMSGLTDLQRNILKRLSTAGQSAVPSDQLQEELMVDQHSMAGALRELVEGRHVKLHRGTGLNGKDRVYLSLEGSNSTEIVSLVLEAIRASGTNGIDQVQLTSKLRLSRSDVGKALNILLSQKHIQEQRHFTNRAKRLYLLFHLVPSDTVTGGTFYSGEEMDVAFVDELRRRMVAYVTHKRSVSLDQIVQYMEENTAASRAGGGHTGGHSSCHGRLSGDDEISSPIAFINTSGSVACAPKSSSCSVAAPTALAKHVSPRDIRILVNTLVLDGVLDEVTTSAESQFQLASGKNVMRHFTALRKRNRGASNATLERDLPSNRLLLNTMRASKVSTDDGGGRQRVMALLREEGMWEPAPISRPSAGGESAEEWQYIPAVGYPCLGCPQLANCTTSRQGVINPYTCAFLRDWLV